MTDTESADIVIIGMGIGGLAAAYELSSDHDVIVIDKDHVGSGTTGRASGVIAAPAVYPDLPAWGDHAISFFEELDGTGIFSFTPRRRVQPIPPSGKGNATRYGQQEGISYFELDDIEERHRDLFADLSEYVGLIEYEHTGVIDIHEYLFTLKRVAEENGAVFRPDTEVEEVLVDGNVIEGVRTEYGTVRAPRVVCTAGWGSRALLENVIELPMRPLIWNAIVVSPDQVLPDDYPIGVETDLGIYWRPTREGDLLIGREYPISSADEIGIDPEFERLVREEIPMLLRGFEEATIVREEYCRTFDSTTPDTRPILDAPDSGPEGLVIATGFHGTGVMDSPCIATAVRSLITGESCPFPLDRFALDRFDTRSADFPFRSLYDEGFV
jgi:glycine/D-amino acid oxidase-like deaminating enzyme